MIQFGLEASYRAQILDYSADSSMEKEGMMRMSINIFTDILM
jgi:hypothetical protein